ncbi:MAG: hypothetical protein FJZ00_08270 [Candidatus Sericytochromatia bacterium]|uniref:Uncharacterized protein n=1 Tax=Candidatus Tanganyikabacteria bacterium TaxID=2961651 RepID=A0A938BNH5_9BACT|nr:hypothetical protein [Candidatus Tanganyikabacteria bacterium]
MPDPNLVSELRAIVDHHRVNGAKGLDAAICHAILKSPSFTYQDIQDVIPALMEAVDAALSSQECKEKRAIQRGWVVGLTAGAAQRGFNPEEIAYVMAYNGLRCAVDAAMILAVYAFSLAWALAQVSVRLGWPRDLKPKLHEAMVRGLADAETHLGDEVEPQERKWMRENLVTGWRAGIVLAKFLPDSPLVAASR